MNEGNTELSFTNYLRTNVRSEWRAATEHEFTEELIAGTLPDPVFERYLVQEFAFIEALASAVGHGAGQAPTLTAKAELSSFLESMATEGTTYFERAFDALAVPECDRRDPALYPITARFGDLLLRAALEGGYAETLSVIVPVEWISLTWAQRANGRRPEQCYFDEWIDFHSDPAFESTVSFLRDELDSAAETLSCRRRRRVSRLFEQAVVLEAEFFEMAYEADR